MKSLFNFLNCVFVRLIVNWISKTVHDCDADFVILLSNYKTRDVYQKYVSRYIYILLLNWNIYILLNLNHCLHILVFYYFYWLLATKWYKFFCFVSFAVTYGMLIYEFVIYIRNYIRVVCINKICFRLCGWKINRKLSDFIYILSYMDCAVLNIHWFMIKFKSNMANQL